nr:MAG TPA: hypothetical protein [Bacteriophage sp.]
MFHAVVTTLYSCTTHSSGPWGSTKLFSLYS